MVFTIRNFLNMLKWSKKENPSKYRIIYLSRGAPNDREELTADAITGIYSRGFEYERRGKKVYIPYHRIIKIENIETGEIVYKSVKHPGKY